MRVFSLSHFGQAKRGFDIVRSLARSVGLNKNSQRSHRKNATFTPTLRVRGFPHLGQACDIESSVAIDGEVLARIARM